MASRRSKKKAGFSFRILFTCIPLLIVVFTSCKIIPAAEAHDCRMESDRVLDEVHPKKLSWPPRHVIPEDRILD
jgi:hypothetical protein